MGMGVHILVSLLLIVAGIYTQKKWNSGKDVSRHTFLVISMPCPVCLGALALSCMLLSELSISGIKIGLLVGIAFFIAIVGSSFFSGWKIVGKTPETLGSAHDDARDLLSVRGYAHSGVHADKTDEPFSTGGGETGIVPLLVCGVIVLASFFLE